MRLLLTTDTIGGVWTFTRELTEGLLARGHAVALVSFGRAPLPHQAAWAAGMRERAGEQFCYIPTDAPLEWMQNNSAAYTRGATTLRRVAEEFAPDLLHTNQFCFGCLPVALPRLVGAHSDVFSWARACRPHGLAPSPWLARYRALVERGLDGAAAVAAPTRWMAEELARHFALHPPPVHVILNGRTLPLEDAAAPMLQAPPVLQAVSAGRLWDEAKNLALLAGMVESPVPILVAGEVAHEGLSSFSRARSMQLLGALGEDDLLALFRQSAIYLAPSLYEPFGLAPLEAALCGCAVVANDLPSLREIWGEAALYFAGESALTQLLRGLARDPAALRAARARSHRHALTLNADRMTEAYLSLYMDLCGTAVRVAPPTREAAYA